jgi:hypothetical protein
MGGYQQGPGGGDRVVQSFQAPAVITNTTRILGAPAFWYSPNGPRYYLWGVADEVKAYSLTLNGPVRATIQPPRLRPARPT